jgi:glycosyltransferase involved in cell wall biosynthesis
MAKVSTATPVYNGEKYIGECIDSILMQEVDIEVNVVDDGSTDSTAYILKSYGDRINYFYQENAGSGAALAAACAKATGDYIAWVSADDVYMPGKLKMQHDYMESHPHIAVTYTDFIIIDGDGNEKELVRAPAIMPGRLPIQIILHNIINGSTTMIRKECFAKAGNFDGTQLYDADADFWLRLLLHGYHIAHIPEVTLKYRWHDSNLSHDTKEMQRYKDRTRLRAVRGFPPERLFPGVAADQYSKHYKQLANALFQQGMYQTAQAALQMSENA